MVEAVVAVVTFDLAGNIDVDGIARMSAGRQRLGEVGEVGYMLVGLKLAGVSWEHKRVNHRMVEEGRTWLL